MRIAIAGTHRNGKTTLAEAIARARPEFEVVAEPYEQLLEQGEDILDPYAPEAFTRQLEHQVSSLSRCVPGDEVIFDRSPLDFLAYLAATDGTAGWGAIELDVLEIAAFGLQHLDLIAWLPLNEKGGNEPGRSFRRSVDDRLRSLVVSDPLGLLNEQKPDLLELRGSTGERLATLLQYLDQTLLEESRRAAPTTTESGRV
jgi:hypothetical protein